MKNLRVIATALLALLIFSSAGDAWNISPHMVNGAITYQILQRDSPATIAKVRAILEKHPRYPDHWRDDIVKLPESQRDEMLFMLAARWADDIKTHGPSESHPA